jgi:hypothetical protein
VGTDSKADVAETITGIEVKRYLAIDVWRNF